MKSNKAAKPVEGPGLADILGRIADLSEAIREAAPLAEKAGALPKDLMRRLHDAQLFRLLLPLDFGGLEFAPLDFFACIEAVAREDASTAWCLCQANGCAMAAAHLDGEVANRIWGNDPHAVLAWGPPGPDAHIALDGDGYRVNGSWTFASGAHHASWFGAQGPIRDSDGVIQRDSAGKEIWRIMLMPADQVELRPTWDVIGLRATGSDSYQLRDAYVSAPYVLNRGEGLTPRVDRPLYRFPNMSLYAVGFAGTALGVARAMLEDYKTLAIAKKPRLSKLISADDGAVQSEVALCEARLGAARAYLLAEMGDIWQRVQAGADLEIEQRMRIRLIATHAIQEAREVGSKAYELAGATAIFESGAFERRFRDLHTVTQQLQGRRAHYRSVGAYLLGLPPDMAVI